MTEETTVVISGGGPAGMMLGLLLARAGIEVTVLEKHGDFLRDFRGDTVHASTVRLMDQLGLGEAFRAMPQSRLGNFELTDTKGRTAVIGDFGTLEAPYDYVAMIPQWDLLNFLAREASHEPTFTLRQNTEATGLVRETGRVAGVRYRTADGDEGELRSRLTVVCEGRHSVLREEAGLTPKEYPVPFDTWWFKLPRFPGEQAEIARLIPEFQGNEILLGFVRETYYQVAYFAEKGSDPRLRAEGVERFRERVAGLAPQWADRVDAITSMDDLHMLNVRLNRLPRWYVPGMLCIGDAAHAMSPAAGMGINLAIQDAVAAATLLADPIRSGSVTTEDLRRVQRRRWRPMVIVQGVQRVLHRNVFAAAFAGKRSGPPPVVLFLARRMPAIRRVLAQLIAFGPRPEHAPEFARRG